MRVPWKTLNSQIGYVGQEPVLFAGTIALNIANGKQGATEDESETYLLYFHRTLSLAMNGRSRYYSLASFFERCMCFRRNYSTPPDAV